MSKDEFASVLEKNGFEVSWDAGVPVVLVATGDEVHSVFGEVQGLAKTNNYAESLGVKHKVSKN